MRDYFEDYEKECGCGCSVNNIDDTFLQKLNEARKIADLPFVMSSMSRCSKHNKEEGGSDTSSHLADKENKKCKAGDIATPTSFIRYKVLTALIQAGFTRIGISDYFIHADSDENKPNATWVY